MATTTVSKPPLIGSLSVSGFRNIDASDADYQRAKQLMVAQRHAEKKDSVSHEFNHKDATPILISLARGLINDATPGLAQALLKHGASVNIARPKSSNLFKKMSGQDQVDVRSHVLKEATQNCAAEVVWVLAREADNIARAEALPMAIQMNDPLKAVVLLSTGADASPLCLEFLSLIDSPASDEMLKTLLQWEVRIRGPCQNCRDEGLLRAVKVGSVTKIKILLEKGANASYREGAALMAAVASGKDYLVQAIVMTKKVSLETLDAAVGVAYEELQAGLPQLLPARLHILRQCIWAGAKGPKAEQALTNAVQEGRLELIDDLINNGLPIQKATIRFAIKGRQPRVLRGVLRSQPAQPMLAVGIDEALKLQDITIAHAMIDLLLSAGLEGPPVGDALVAVLEVPATPRTYETRLSLVKLLLEKGRANINLHQGRSISIAASQGLLDILSLLLKFHPAPEYLDNALVLAAGGGDHYIGLTKLLITQASVDYDSGKSLVCAAKSRSIIQLSILVAARPSPTSLANAWAEINTVASDDKFQLDAFTLLLDTGLIGNQLQDTALVTAAARGKQGHVVCRLLLSHLASPDCFNGRAIIAAATGLHLGTLQLLATSPISQPVASSALRAMTAQGDQWLTSEGLSVMQFLLQQGACASEIDHAFCVAARSCQRDAFDLLATCVNDPCVFSQALACVTQYNAANWQQLGEKDLWAIHYLLEWGADQVSVDLAFLRAVEAAAANQTSEALIDTFLSVGVKANINFQRGKALSIAASSANTKLLRKLMTYGASTKSLSHAFTSAITATLEEKSILAVIDVLVEDEAMLSDLRMSLEPSIPPIIACLMVHPQYVKLVKRLIKLGCDLEAEVDSMLYVDGNMGQEPVTVLMWAICQDGQRSIPVDTINTLIAAKANINFTSPKTRTTPLILASKYGRADIVKKLLKAGANYLARDRFNRSALFYASGNGDLASVSALSKVKSTVNDGSLHEAARCLKNEVAAALIKAGHKANFPSSDLFHKGRTPLQELVFMSDCGNDIAGLEATIRTLIIQGEAKVLSKWYGRNSIFLALNNTRAFEITRALLDIAAWECINEEENVYEEKNLKTGETYSYSPSMYLRKRCPPDRVMAVLPLLYDKGCVDRFYAPLGSVQPPDAVGLPTNIAKAEEKRREEAEKQRKRDFEHEQNLRRQREEGQQKIELQQQQHQVWKVHEQEKGDVKLGNQTRQHHEQVMHKSQLSFQEQEAMARKNAMIAMKQREDEAQRLRKIDQQQMALEDTHTAKLDFQRRQNAQKQVGQKAMNKLEEKKSQQQIAKQRKLNHLAEKKSDQQLVKQRKMNQLANKKSRQQIAKEEKMNQLRRQDDKRKILTKKSLNALSDDE